MPRTANLINNLHDITQIFGMLKSRILIYVCTFTTKIIIIKLKHGIGTQKKVSIIILVDQENAHILRDINI